ncbi:MAG: lipocalin family protein [Tenuifilaceae bacterium]|nr:lipocalin family protein [Tenuifilaceae bacterium]
MNRIILFCVASFAALSFNTMAQSANEQIIAKDMELKKFLGVWYEIARFPHSFERDLVGVTATYSLKKNGNIQVINQGYKNTLDGKLKRAKAFAKIPNPSEPGRLKVYFFWPFGADYLILDLGKEYQWALVGSSSPSYLWILSRTPQMDDGLYESIIEKAKSIGYNTSRLELVPQKVEE